MLKFAQWLEANNAPPIRFGSFWNDGSIVVHINGIRYVYRTDAAYHERWKHLAQHQPFKVLNQIKDLVKNGHAQQVEPKLKPEQGTLF